MTEEVTAVDAVEAVEAVEATEEVAQPSLTLQDLILVTQVIQLTANRGGIRAEEFEVVGALYSKIITFLQATGAITVQDEAAAQEVPADEATAETESN